MARHRAPGYTAVVVTGLVAVATGVALLVVPAAPIEARSGSVLGPAPSSAAAHVPEAGAPTPTAPTHTEPAPAAPGPAAPAPPAPAPVGPAPAEAPRAVPVPVLNGFIPERLAVPALDVDASLVTTRVDGDGALVPPDDPDQLGWWRGVRPGTGAGSVVVAGHIDSTRFGQGPLARLVDLVPGDRAVLSGPGGTRVEYAVRGVETFPKDELPAAELFSPDGAERLVLVTCGGLFDRRTGSWDSNIVAVLDPIPPV
jgi:Sortase domain